MFRALVLEKEGDVAVARMRELEDSALPAGDVVPSPTCANDARDAIGVSETGSVPAVPWRAASGHGT